jgi:cell division protein FtsZ
VANTDAQALTMSKAERIIQMGATEARRWLAARCRPRRRGGSDDDPRSSLGRALLVLSPPAWAAAAPAPVIARARRRSRHPHRRRRDQAVHFEGQRRMRVADGGITELQKRADTLLIIPNQNLFR